ncbi:MAG: hypothetical protein Q9169_008242 [Polycauliona sp. 2 TL-2023]
MRFPSASFLLIPAFFNTVSAQTNATTPTIPGLNTSELTTALTFERSNWANSSVEDDSFYRVPSNSSHLPAGTLLKRELYTNTSLYTLPPQTALSRILYQSKDFNGTLVPASAYILWPYSPRTQPDGSYQVIAWGHGTSGAFPDCAPSHIKDMSYQFTAPFPMAIQGYVVVAPDYAGLGVSRKANGEPIIHQIYASQATANDLFYAVEAAQSAFTQLSEEFVVVGHSQGGGAAWAAAERQAKSPVAGYLGAVAAAPVLNLIETIQFGVDLLGAEVALTSLAPTIGVTARAITTVFPDFDVASVLTPAGMQRLQVLEAIQGCNAAAAELFNSGVIPTTQPNVLQNEYVLAYNELVRIGGNPIVGPMLVIQGTADTLIPANITSKYVNMTSERNPDESIEFIIDEGAEHIPSMYTSQRLWLKWIEDRFAGVRVASGLRITERTSALPQTNYQADLNWFLESVTESYQSS